MAQVLIEHTWIAVIGVILALVVLEEFYVRDDGVNSGAGRIVTNFLLYGLGLGLIGLIGSFIPFWSGASSSSLIPGFGLIPWLQLPWAFGLGALFLTDSLLSYWLHRASHHFKPLWRLHAVHHSDHVLDVTTGIRHHPLESIPSVAVQSIAAAICGATPAQVIIVSLGNGFWALFTHAAIRQDALDFRRPMGFLVSPAFHRIHHSSKPRLTNSNYANTLAIWDWLFNTAHDPQDESAGEMGLGHSIDHSQSFSFQLLLPFRRRAP